MKNDWQTVPLEKVLKRVKQEIPLDATKIYKEVTVRLWNKGVVLRGEKQGIEIKTARYSIRAGQLILSRIDVRNGAIGLVPTELDGAIVSGEFWTYEIDQTLLDSKFLEYCVAIPDFIEKSNQTSSGTTNRIRAEEELFLQIEIPLPPLREQQRIVARIEELARRVEEARGLRKTAVEEAGAIISSALYDIFVGESGQWQKMAMPKAIAINDRQVDPRLPEYSKLPHISGENIESKTCKLLPYRTAEADEVKSSNYLFFPHTILYSKIRPYLRKSVYVDFQGVCSADIYPIKVISDELEPRFIMWSLVANPFSEYANRLSGRTRMPKLNRDQLFAYWLTYPKKDEQHRIVAYLDSLQEKVDELRRLQTAAQKELDALLPSILAKAFAGEL